MLKAKKQALVAKWEIITTATVADTEYKDKAVDDAFFERVFHGNFVRIYRDNRTDAKQLWRLNIVTRAVDSDGQVHTLEVDWNFDKPMTISEVLKGAKHIKVNESGIKKRWLGITKKWLEIVDEDLKDMDCIDAWATATCVAMVKPETATGILLRGLKNVK